MQSKDEEFCDEMLQQDHEYALWECMLQSDIAHYESQLQSLSSSLQDLQLELETVRVRQALEEQRTFVFETEARKLRSRYDGLRRTIEAESLCHHEELEVMIGAPRQYGKELVFPGNVFSVILSMMDIESIFKLERVSVSWYDAIHCWKGWVIGTANPQSTLNNLVAIRKYKEQRKELRLSPALAVSEASSSNYSSDADKLFYPRFRRFVLSIETQKNNMYQIEIVGYSDKTVNASSSIQQDKGRKRVTIQPIEGVKQFEREFSICDVVLGNHQRLARMKEKCERLRSRCESDKSTQRGYQLTTRELQRDIERVDKEVKELELQQTSDLNTIKFLRKQIELKAAALKEAQDAPERLKEEERRQNAEFEVEMKKLEGTNNDNMQRIILKTRKEKETLTTAIKLEQSNLRAITEKREQLKAQYEWLKDRITKMTETDDLL